MKNYKGETISGIRQLKRPEYGTGEKYKNGNPIVDWSHLSKYADKNGFDTRHREKNGKYRIRIRLPYGSVVIRYGSEAGQFTAPSGTEYEKLSLPYIKETIEYNEYQVISDNVTIICIVDKGKVAPGFDSPGGAIQYYHPITIRESIRRGLLKRIKNEI